MQAAAYPPQQPRMSAGFSNPSLNAQYGIPNYAPIQTSQQIRPQIPMHFSTSFQPQMQYNQQPFVVQNLIQPQPQLQYQQQIVQQPPIQFTQPAQVERRVNYVPKTRQVVKMQEQEIEEIVPVERTIIEYIPVQTIIEKIPVPVEIPYEVHVPRAYDQELHYPNTNNEFVTDHNGFPINPYIQPMQEPAEQAKGGQQVTVEEEDLWNEFQESEDDDEADDILIEKYKKTIELIEERKKRRNRRGGGRGKQSNISSDEDDFDSRAFSKYMKNSYDYDEPSNKYSSMYSRYNQRGIHDSQYRQQDSRRGYQGKGKSSNDYLKKFTN